MLRGAGWFLDVVVRGVVVVFVVVLDQAIEEEVGLPCVDDGRDGNASARGFDEVRAGSCPQLPWRAVEEREDGAVELLSLRTRRPEETLAPRVDDESLEAVGRDG